VPQRQVFSATLPWRQGFTNVEVALYDAAQAVLKKSQFNPMYTHRYLAERLGRFASFLTGAHVSDTSPKSTNRDYGAETSRV